ncbi:pantothenate synthase [Nowakowskiella sp. JEL0407]|nr:pantothenate synthase [Nowakowskiella sp. JEL0407]
MSQLIKTPVELRQLRNVLFRNARTVGFVPTMGALHDGHLALVSLAKKQCDVVICSIFVNPAQFAPTEDLSRYPRTLDSDMSLLSSKSCDYVFVPSVEDMYPAGVVLDVSQQFGTFVEVKGLSHQMEGSIRPHFFRGVATVVSKLFNLIQPTHAYFGQKDAQQSVVVRSLIRDLCFPIELVVGETVRESDGLAMSSRNRYLEPKQREIAPLLYRALCAGQSVYQNAVEKGIQVHRDDILHASHSVISDGQKLLKEDKEADFVFDLEYLSIADPYYLKEVDVLDKNNSAIFSGALKVGKTRIIDNVGLGLRFAKYPQ